MVVTNRRASSGFDFTFENPGDPFMHIVTGADEPNIIYGTSGDGSLTGGD